MTNSLAVLAAVQAGARLLQGGDQILAQKLRNKAIVLNSPAQITAGLGLASSQPSWSGLTAPIMDETIGFQAWLKEADLWLPDAGGQPLEPANYLAAAGSDAALKDKIRQSYAVFEERYGNDGTSAATLKEGLMAIPEIPQFYGHDDPNRPLSVSAQFGLLLIDTAAAYLAINPHALDLDETGGILVQAFAKNIESAVDPATPGPGDGRLGVRLFGILLQSGLKVAHDHGGLVVAEEHAEALVKAVTEPLIETMQGASLAEELKWEKVLDTFAGPVFTGTLEVLIEHQGDVFGNDLGADEAAGALIRSVLTTLAQQQTIQDAFSPSAVLAIYKAALGVVVERPELIAGGANADAFLKDLVSELADTLKKHEGLTIDEGGALKIRPDGLGPALAVATLTALQGHASSLLGLDVERPLEKAASEALDHVLTGLQEGLTNAHKLTEFLGQETLVELVRVFVSQAAETPQMLIDGESTSSEELRVIVSGIASAMAADDGLLVLGQDGWLQVAEVAIGLAARNPGRLFGLKMTEPRQELAAIALATLLTSAKETLEEGRKSGGVLFGDTLKQAVIDTLEMIASNPHKATLAFGLDVSGANVVAGLIGEINQIISLAEGQNRYRMGSGEWLALYRHALSDLLSALDIEVSGAGTVHVTCKPTAEGTLPLCQPLPNKQLRFIELVEQTSPPKLTAAGEAFIERYLS